jgi:hypothetical protein
MSAKPHKSCRPRSTSSLGRGDLIATAFGRASEPRPRRRGHTLRSEASDQRKRAEPGDPRSPTPGGPIRGGVGGPIRGGIRGVIGGPIRGALGAKKSLEGLLESRLELRQTIGRRQRSRAGTTTSQDHGGGAWIDLKEPDSGSGPPVPLQAGSVAPTGCWARRYQPPDSLPATGTTSGPCRGRPAAWSAATSRCFMRPGGGSIP